MTTQLFAALCCLTMLITNSSLAGRVKHHFNVGAMDEPHNQFQHFVQELLSCPMCTGFWVFLAATQDWQWTCIGPVACHTISKIISRI